MLVCLCVCVRTRAGGVGTRAGVRVRAYACGRTRAGVQPWPIEFVSSEPVALLVYTLVVLHRRATCMLYVDGDRNLIVCFACPFACAHTCARVCVGWRACVRVRLRACVSVLSGRWPARLCEYVSVGVPACVGAVFSNFFKKCTARREFHSTRFLKT